METAIKERPILFSGPMVRAILDGRKTVTRRVIKGRDPRWEIGESDDGSPWPYYPCYVYAEPQPIDLHCPYGCLGDRLWVREAWQAAEPGPIGPGALIVYRADYRDDPHGPDGEKSPEGRYRRWRPSIHMPRWASRITLEVVDVRVEPVQDITEAEAEAEGFERTFGPDGSAGWGVTLTHATDHFAALWDQLNASRGYSWESNPWVWRVEFRQLTEDQP